MSIGYLFSKSVVVVDGIAKAVSQSSIVSVSMTLCGFVHAGIKTAMSHSSLQLTGPDVPWKYQIMYIY